MKNTLFSLFLIALLISCTQRTVTTTTTNPDGSTIVTAATEQPAYTGTSDYYGNSDFGYGGMWDVYGHYIYFSGPNYQYRMGGMPYYYHVPYGVSIYQPSIRTYGYSSRTTITSSNGRSISRSATSTITPQRTAPSSSFSSGGNTVRSNGSFSSGRSSTPAPSVSRPSSSFGSGRSSFGGGSSRSSGSFSSGRRR